MRARLVVAGALLVAAGGWSCSKRPLGPLSNSNGPGDPASTAPPPYDTRALDAGGVITAADPAGRPRFIRALGDHAAPPGSSAEAAALWHFARFAPAYGIAGDAMAGTAVGSLGRTPRGDYLVRLVQDVGGIPVYRGEVKVLMREDLSLVALSGTASDLTGVKPPHGLFALTPGQALGKALEHLYGVPVPPGAPVGLPAATPPYLWLDLPAGAPVRLSDPARARRVYYRAGKRLTAAYDIELFSSRTSSTGSEAYRYLVAADDGRTLERHNLTADVAFSYRVFAETTGERRPLDGPIGDFTPHPTGLADGTDPAFVPPALVVMESFKQRPLMALDPWLPGGAVQTLGNNVDAYADLSAPDGFSNGDLRATTTAPLTFDRAYDVTREPGASADQTMAAITNLFYIVNWQHDYWYDSGFDEAAGNAQTSNFGRGGLGNDAIRAEAQDYLGRNNANMATPSDGLAPRMQMYLWSPPERRSLTILPGSSSLDTGSADFGPGNFDVTAPVVLIADGIAPASDGCTPPTSSLAGKIALVDRGACSFVVKAQVAEAAGAVGIIIVNNVPGPPIGMANSTPPTMVNIPSLGMSLDDGNKVKALLAGVEATVSARMFRQLIPPGRDGSLDNMIVSHEWGHYLHHRLSDCGSVQCGALSEGWADFVSLLTALREGDRLDGTYGAGIYAPKRDGDSGYFGIRRFPYSVDPGKNALTLGHISNAAVLPAVPANLNGFPNSEPHNAGEVWASMLFEAYVSLQKNPAGRTFAEVRRAFASDLVLGLQLAPPDATYTESRDAILTAVAHNTPADLPVVAAAFARRGAGSCAVSPPVEATMDLAPVSESFALQPSLAITSIALDDSVESCDRDGILDGGETGRVQVSVANNGPTAMAGTQITLTTPTIGVVFPDGPSAALPEVPPFGSASVTIAIGLAPTVTEATILALTVTAANAAACKTSVAELRTPRIHADQVPLTATTEDVESLAPPWNKTGAGAGTVWSRATLSPTNHAWHGADSGTVTDTQLVSPPLQVAADRDLQISFQHAFSFELSDDTAFDGGLIELSTDDGATWRDISAFASPGYNATITTESDNPLGGRAAYGGVNPSFPALDPVSLNLGRALAGQTIRLRFRVATDGGTNAPGWTIDDIAFQGLANTPFTTVVTDRHQCQEPPVANAGPDRTVTSGADVILDASGSHDVNGDPLTYQWTQISGRRVALFNASQAVAAFRAPPVARSTVLAFRLTVSDPSGASTDTVQIRVRPRRDDVTEVPPVE